MSKYTVEVRYICEQAAGLNESVGYKKVEDVIAKAIPVVFDFHFPIFDPMYSDTLKKKILYHFYTREIGLETISLWKLKLRVKLNEIMPYYNRLYALAAKDFDPMRNVDVKTEHKGKEEAENRRGGSENTTSVEHSNGTNQSNTTHDNQIDDSGKDSITRSDTEEDGRTITDTRNDNLKAKTTNDLSTNTTNKYSETPQGGLSGLQNDTYLTNASIDSKKDTGSVTVDNTGTQSNKRTVTGNLVNSISETNNKTGKTIDKGSTAVNGETSSTSDGTVNKSYGSIDNNDLTREYLERRYGYEGVNMWEMLMQMADKFFDIDMMIMNDLDELFMQIW